MEFDVVIQHHENISTAPADDIKMTFAADLLTDVDEVVSGWTKLPHATNFTYVRDTTNFPGINKTLMNISHPKHREIRMIKYNSAVLM